jgi:Zn-dependent membrane protease YugP
LKTDGVGKIAGCIVGSNVMVWVGVALPSSAICSPLVKNPVSENTKKHAAMDNKSTIAPSKRVSLGKDTVVIGD